MKEKNAYRRFNLTQKGVRLNSQARLTLVSPLTTLRFVELDTIGKLVPRFPLVSPFITVEVFSRKKTQESRLDPKMETGDWRPKNGETQDF